MLKQTSKSFRKVFILEFTKELIKNTEKYKKLTIKKEVKKVLKEEPQIKEGKKKLPQKEELRKIVHEKIKEKNKRISQLKKEETPFEGSIENIKKEFKKESRPVKTPAAKSSRSFPGPLRITEPLLPETVRYIKPVPIHKEIDLGKLNPLIKDPFVNIVECFGPGQKIIVSGRMGRKKTPITLTKEEIDKVVKKFSESSKIPVHEGILNIAFGRLHLLSIISEVTSPRFLIRKMPNIPPAYDYYQR